MSRDRNRLTFVQVMAGGILILTAIQIIAMTIRAIVWMILR